MNQPIEQLLDDDEFDYGDCVRCRHPYRSHDYDGERGACRDCEGCPFYWEPV